MKKGTIVLVHAIAATDYMHEEWDVELRTSRFVHPAGAELVHKPSDSKGSKNLYHWSIKTIRGVYVGYSYRATGHYSEGYQGPEDSYPEPPYLAEDKRHRVFLVQPLQSDRWVKPWVCLPADVELASDFEAD